MQENQKYFEMPLGICFWIFLFFLIIYNIIIYIIIFKYIIKNMAAQQTWALLFLGMGWTRPSLLKT